MASVGHPALMWPLVCVAVGGAVGAACRYALAQWLASAGMGASPWPVVWVNGIGCFLYGACGAGHLPPMLRLTLLTGVLGGFTTFSSYISDAQATRHVGLWLMLTPALGYFAYRLGFALATAIQSK